jgi:hypothetical protein
MRTSTGRDFSPRLRDVGKESKTELEAMAGCSNAFRLRFPLRRGMGNDYSLQLIVPERGLPCLLTA